MSSVSILQGADDRADALRGAYREAGFWSGDPVDLVRDAAVRCAAATAVIDRSGAISYAELDLRIERAAKTLKSSGVGPGTPVLLTVGNDLESVVAVHAVLRADAVVLLAPRNAGRAHLVDIVASAGAEVGVAPKAWVAAAGLGDVCTWLDLSGADGEHRGSPLAPSRAADAPSVVLYTSGTTSKPKGVIHSMSTLGKAAKNHIVAAGLTRDDKLFMVSPLASVTGALQALFIAPILTAPVILEDTWDPAKTFDLLVSSGGTWFGGPDRLLDRLLDEAVRTEQKVPLRAAYLGGTMLDRRVVERIEHDFGVVVMRAYGSSEVPTSTSGLRGDPEQLRHAYDGVPLDDVDVRIGSAGNAGECCIRGPHAFLGYTDPQDNALAFEQGWYRTGDLAELTGGRIRIVGRIRDIVIRNGLKIPVAEVDEAINNLPGIRQCAGYSVPDPTTGEHLAVAVVVAPGADVTLDGVIASLISSGLPKYKLPEELVIWDEPLPTNANGKVERTKLHVASRGRLRQNAHRLA